MEPQEPKFDFSLPGTEGDEIRKYRLSDHTDDAYVGPDFDELERSVLSLVDGQAR